jgi:SnoaL-like domain
MTQTTQTTDTVIDRYIRIFDRSAQDPAALDELQSIFAPDATIQLSDEQEPVTGFAAIMELYRFLAAGMADSKHIWTTTVLDDGTLECRWVSVARAADGGLGTHSGIEHATVNADGLITNLRNRMVPPGS